MAGNFLICASPLWCWPARIVLQLPEFFRQIFAAFSDLRIFNLILCLFRLFLWYHRVSTPREEKGGGCTSSLKLNLTDPCRTAYSTVLVPRCQAGRLGHQFQYMRECNAESPKQDSKMFNSQEALCLSGYDLSMSDIKRVQYPLHYVRLSAKNHSRAQGYRRISTLRLHKFLGNWDFRKYKNVCWLRACVSQFLIFEY